MDKIRFAGPPAVSVQNATTGKMSTVALDGCFILWWIKGKIYR
jgi:hypothetical protein